MSHIRLHLRRIFGASLPLMVSLQFLFFLNRDFGNQATPMYLDSEDKAKIGQPSASKLEL
jgi:hypothetical protein